MLNRLFWTLARCERSRFIGAYSLTPNGLGETLQPFAAPQTHAVTVAAPPSAIDFLRIPEEVDRGRRRGHCYSVSLWRREWLKRFAEAVRSERISANEPTPFTSRERPKQAVEHGMAQYSLLG